MLYFLHIPKTAGMTLLKYVSAQYPAGEVALIYNGELTMWRPNIEFVCDLRKRATKIVCGHYAFGAHVYLGDTNPRYICFMRHPVARIQSFFAHQKRDPEARLHASIQRGLTLEQAILSRAAPELNNYVTRILGVNLDLLIRARACIDTFDGFPHPLKTATGFLNGLAHSDVGPFDQIFNDIHLQTALTNIEHYFSFIGISERMLESMHCLAKGLGWSEVAADPERINEATISHQGMSERAVELIHDYNRLDLELYNRYAGLSHNRF